MLKLYRNVLAAGVVALGLAACGDNVTVTNPPTPTPLVHQVTVVPASLTANVGQTGIVFVASVVADSGLSSAVSWTSTNTAVATVNATTGAVVAVAPGQATIVATSTADLTKTGAGSITVVALPPNVIAFTVTPTNANIAVGGTLQVNPSVTLSPGAPAATITYATSSAATATVSATGQITGVSNGTAVITATATSGTQTATATVGVTVGAGPQGVVSFSVTPSAMTLFATQTQQATATVVSPGFTYPVTWTSLAPSVATVSSTGLVTGVAQGTAIINATIGTAPNTLTQSIVVTVAQGVSISINAVNAGSTAGNGNAGTGIPGCAGITGAPVQLTNVNCQIDVVLNLSAGVQPLDSLNVYMQRGTVAAGAPTFAGKATPVCAAASAPCPFYKRANQQLYGNTIPSSGLVTLSINTANFAKNPAAGTTTVDWFNGPTGMISQVFPHGLVGGQVQDCQIGAADQQCAFINSMVFTNTDGWSADIQKCSGGTGVIQTITPTCAAAAPSTGIAGATTGTNTSTGGFANASVGQPNAGLTYWGGPTGSGQTTAEIYAVIYNDNPGFPSGSSLNRCNNVLGNGTGCINSVTWSLGIPVPNVNPNTPATIPTAAQWCAAITQTTLPFRRTFGTGTGSTSSCNNYENVTPIRDNVVITASIDGVNNPFTTVGTLTGTAPIAGPANPNFTLIANAVVPFSTPDSARYDYKFSGTVTTPTVIGAEGQNWVNKNWLFKPAGTLVTDGGVGPASATWASFCSNAGTANSNCAQGTSATFTTNIVTGNDPVMLETTTKTVDAYNAVALGTDLLGNGGNSNTVGTFGVDRTAPLIRISTVAAPSSEGAGVYAGGGASTVLDSTTYNAVEGVYGALVATAGARVQFISTTYGTADSFRIEAQDNRAGLRRAIGNTNRFGQNGGTGLNTSVNSYNCLLLTCGLPNTIDNWVPVPALHVLAGAPGTGLQATPGYYTTYEFVVDNAGNVSGCPVAGNISGSVCPAASGTNLVASTTTSTSTVSNGSNPAMTGGNLNAASGNANLFGRRTLALDPGQPQVTGLSPVSVYTGNQAITYTLGSQDDLEVIDARLRLQYPNLSSGTVADAVSAAPGLVWSYALSNTFMATGNSAGPSSAAFAPATVGTGVNFGFFAPIGIRFDGAPSGAPGAGLGIVNPNTTQFSLDQFTVNVQETCTNAAPPGTGVSSGHVVATACNLTGVYTAGVPVYVGDPQPCTVATANGCTTAAGGVALAKPNVSGIQVRDVFGSWVFNDNPGSATTGVSAETAPAILSATVPTPGGYTVGYYSPSGTSSCAAGGAVQAAGSVSCVASGINWRGDLFLTSGTTKVYRSTEPLSNSLPLFTRAELYGLNALGQWVFVQRINVPQGLNAIPVGACPANAAALTNGAVQGCDNGFERYWFFTFSSAGAAFSAYRAIGVNGSGFGLASTIN